jgi:hypothetical protein
MKTSVTVTQAIPSWYRYRFIIGMILMFATCTGGAFAQVSGAGSIQGTITDSTGAIIPQAAIHVANTKTGVTFNTVANKVGFYQAPSLFTGEYAITVKAAGMKTDKRTIELLVGQDAQIDFKMVPGSVDQSVEVTGDLVQLVTKNSGTISSTLENSRINQLPMNGRDLTTLMNETTPGLGACSDTTSPTCANGLPSGAIEFSSDGVTLNQREFGGVKEGQAQLPDADAVQEIKVVTVAAGAEYASPAAAVITTKSGTNAIHGTLFETARNNALGLARSRNDLSNFVAPHYVRNEFGVSAGGPIVIPRLYNGKNKSFWFFSYERYSLAQEQYNNESVPTAAMRSGDFSGLVNGSALPETLYDPLTTAASTNCNGTGQTNQWCRQPFPTINGLTNQIPTGRESPTTKILMDITPLPSNSNNPLVSSNLSYKANSYYTRPSVTFRVDQVFTQNTRAYVRYTENIENQFANSFATLAADGLPYGASGISNNPDKLYAYALGISHVISPTFFSETTLSQNWFAKVDAAGSEPNVDFAPLLGMPDNFGDLGFPAFKDILSPIAGSQTGYAMTQTISTIQEHLTKILGKHQLLFGFDDRYEHFGSRPDERQDDALFNGQDTALEDPTTDGDMAYSATSRTGDENADEFLGGAYDYTYNLEAQYQHIDDNSADAYIQDDYRVRHNLTLNLGLRYEAHPAVKTSNAEMLGFDLKNDAMVLAAPESQLIAEGLTTAGIITADEAIGVKFESAQEAGYPTTTLLNSYNFTWGPRLGVAWLPFRSNWGTVLRGGLGRYIYPDAVRNELVDIVKNNPFANSYAQDYALASQSPDSLPNYTLRSKQTTTLGVNSADVINTSAATGVVPGFVFKSLNPRFAPDYVTEADVTLEQPLKWNTALRVSYVYTHGSNITQYDYYNNHPSSYNWEMATGTAVPTGTVVGSNQYAATATGPYDQKTYGANMQEDKTGWSNYNALQVNYQKLYSHGVAFQFSYVWAKSLDTAVTAAYDPYQNFVDSGLGTVTQAYGAAIPAGAPPALPSGVANWGFYHALDKFENYGQDASVPKQLFRINGIVDLPFGRGKHFFGNTNRAVNEIIGGWQVSGVGFVTSRAFGITSSNWGTVNPLKIYKNGPTIKDCRTGNCYAEKVWFNGYIVPSAIAGNACATPGATNLIYGLPSDYQPYQSPIDVGCPGGVHDTYFGDNEVKITLANGKTSNITYAPSPAGGNPFSHTIIQGPWLPEADLSLFKVFPITHGVLLRVNVDAFNAFYIQGQTLPSGSTGIMTYVAGGTAGASSANAARQIQLTARLTF